MAVPDRIQTLLRERTRFARLRHEASCSSTQDLAAAAPAGDLCVWADHQTKGRGRQQHSWHDEPGTDLAVTFRFTQMLPVPLALPAAVPVAVAAAVEAQAGLPPGGPRLRVKWPNDLLLDGQKLCGVLIDAGTCGPHSYLVGIGVNVNRTRFPPELAPLATSLALATGRETDRAALLLAIAEQLEHCVQDLAAGRLAALQAQFAARLGLLGKAVRLDGPGATGVLRRVDFAAVELDDGRSFPLATVQRIVPA